MDYTQSLNLPQFAATDRIHHDDFNAAFAAIDAGTGNCRIAMGSYVGTGEYGSAHPRTLSYAFTPKMIFIQEQTTSIFNGPAGNMPNRLFALNGVTRITSPVDGNSSNTLLLRLQWSESGVSWYTDTNSSSYNPSGVQLNAVGRTYFYVAIG